MFWTIFTFLKEVTNFKQNDSFAECFEANFKQQDSGAQFLAQVLAF